MKRIIIDCDPGHDDAVAMFMAFAHKELFDVRAITTVCGNNTLEKVTKNAHIVSSIANQDAVIALGAASPLINEPIISSEFHGESGMDGPREFPQIISKQSSKPAIQVIHDILLESNEKTTIVALGPLTNIALFIKCYPELLNRIDLISVMGGGLDHGNITDFAEFNIFVDPEAAQIVFSSGIKICMSGLDVTEKAIIYPNEYEHLRNEGKAGRFFCELMDFYGSHAEVFGTTGCMMHDPCAVAWLIDPKLFDGFSCGIKIELSGEKRGQTISIADKKNVYVLTSVKRDEFAALILKSIDYHNNNNVR